MAKNRNAVGGVNYYTTLGMAFEFLINRGVVFSSASNFSEGQDLVSLGNVSSIGKTGLTGSTTINRKAARRRYNINKKTSS